ncbi:SDR family oxidoreductase [Prescottella agglutinans]|uniref:3-oxoacyl-[acyl-carrier-protein] reductase MabA n=1 Tax=Prescottella agglutinans TaxID=1644129 RepID=A0A3S3AGW8_9NOCA|nr:oxidoreductase [Prescottella agglutinans]RVW07898.1 SDR family oxidoreductase [Prescottella agglutinans]
MDLHLAGKTAVVTGASRGIGLAVTTALAAEGAHVVAGSRTLTAELESLIPGGSVTFVPCDLATPAGPDALVAVAADLGGVDVLVNNAGSATPRLGGFASVTDDDWLATLTVNFMSAVRTTRAALPQLRRRGGGSVVTVSSVNAFLPDPGVIDYCASKAALTNFCKALSKEVARQDIRINTVSPGPVSTALWLGEQGVASVVAGASGSTPQAVRDAAAAGSETGRFTRPEEVADLVLFLASERAGNITGADFVIDGGLIKTL